MIIPDWTTDSVPRLEPCGDYPRLLTNDQRPTTNSQRPTTNDQRLLVLDEDHFDRPVGLIDVFVHGAGRNRLLPVRFARLVVRHGLLPCCIDRREISADDADHGAVAIVTMERGLGVRR